MQKARDTTAKPSPRQYRSFDGFVLAAVTVVAAAFGLALYLQFGVGGGAALVCVLIAHAALTSAHVAIRRGHRIRELSADVERLRQGTLAPPASGRKPQPAAQRPQAGGPRSGTLTARPAEPTAALLPAHPVPPARFEQPMPPHQAGADLSGGPAPPMPAPFETVGPGGPLHPAHGAAEAPITAGDHVGVAQRAAISQMWNLRPGSAREPAMASGPLLTAMPEVVGPVLPMAAAPKPGLRPLTLDAKPAGAMPERSMPESAPPDAAVAPPQRGDDFTTIQALIKRLADDLSAPRKPEPPEFAPEESSGDQGPTDAAVPKDAIIARSVEALRGTADLLRQAAPGAPRREEATPLPAAAPEMPYAEAPQPAPGTALAADAIADDREPFAEALARAVVDDRFAVYVEPIHGLPDGKVRHFEVSVRLDLGAGHEVDPRDLTPDDCDPTLLNRIDGAKFLRTARFAQRLLAKGKRASVHSTIAAASIAEDAFVDRVADGIGSDERLATHLVLSFTQGDVRIFSPVHWEALRTLAAMGVRYAIEDIVDVDMDLEALKAEGFDFVKLDADVLVRGLPAGTVTVPPADICRYLAQLGMSIVVGGIDDDLTRARIMGFGALLGRGALFGGPRQIEVDVGTDAQMAAA